MLIIGGSIVASIVYLVGVFNVADDIMENGKSMKDYRAKYGKDLGLLVCSAYRGAMIGAWPVTIGVKYVFGVIGDIIRLVMGKGPKGAEKE